MELIHKSKRSLEFEDVVGKYCRQSGISTIYLDDISKMKWIPFTKSSLRDDDMGSIDCTFRYELLSSRRKLLGFASK